MLSGRRLAAAFPGSARSRSESARSPRRAVPQGHDEGPGVLVESTRAVAGIQPFEGAIAAIRKHVPTALRHVADGKRAGLRHRIYGADVGLAARFRRDRDLRALRRLQQVEATAAVFGRKAVGIDGVGDEGAVGAAVLGLDLGQRHDLVDDAGQLQAGFAAFDLRDEHLAVVVIEPLVEDRHEHHVLAACVLQMSQCADHFLAEQAIGRAQVGLAGAVADGTRLRLAPREALAGQLGDRIEKEGLVAVELRRVAKLLDDVVVVRLREGALRRQRLVWAREKHEEVAALRPRSRTDGVARPVGHRQVTGLDVEEQRGGWVEVLEPRGFADAGLAQHQQLHALALGHPLDGGHDGELLHAAPPSSVRVMLGLPSSTVRAAANCSCSAVGQLV